MKTSIALNRRFLPCLFVCFFALSLSSAHGTTSVVKTAECEREISIKIEIFSDTDPLKWTDEALEKMDQKTRDRLKELMNSHTSYSPAELQKIAAEWQAEIDAVWNGPTDEQVKNAAEDLGVSEADRKDAALGGDNELRKKLDERAREMLDAAGGDAACTEVNCCKIYFKPDVRVRTKEQPPTPGYHQVTVMIKGYRSNVRSKDGKVEHNHGGTSGSWGYDPHSAWDASCAHETGHLMGLDDEYHEGGGNNDGHDHDVMNGSYGWPQSDSIQKILRLGGAECDCCPKDRAVTGMHFERFGSTVRTAGDAVLTNNCPILRQLLADYETQLANVMATNMLMTDKADLVNRLNKSIADVRKALDNCDPPEETLGLYGDGTLFLGTDLIEWCRFTPETMTPIPVPNPGDDPNDIPVGGPVTTPPGGPATTPPGGPVDTPKTADPGDKPGVVQPPDGGGKPPGGIVVPPFGGSITVTPDDSEGDPTGTAPPEQEEPGIAPPTYFNVKATSTAVAEGAAASPISGLQIKLYPSDVADPALPGSDVARDAETGSDQGPVQGVTGDNGEVKIAAIPSVLGLGGGKISDMTIEINLDPTVTGVVAPEGTPVPGTSEPDETLKIGGDRFGVYYLPADTANSLVGNLIEINICGEKKPIGRGSYSLAELPASAAFSGATISLQGIGGELP